MHHCACSCTHLLLLCCIWESLEVGVYRAALLHSEDDPRALCGCQGARPGAAKHPCGGCVVINAVMSREGR